MRSRTLPSHLKYLIALLLLLAASAAGAQGFQVEPFEPMPGQGLNLLGISRSSTLPHLGFTAGIFVHYLDDSFVIRGDSDDSIVARLVDHQTKAEISVGLGLFDFFDLSAVVPVVVYQGGDDLAIVGRSGENIDGAALQDVRLIPRVRILDPADFDGFGLGLTVIFSVPGGGKDAFASDGGFRMQPRLTADWTHSSGFSVAVNLGYLLRPEQRAFTYVSDDAVSWGLGVEVPTWTDELRVVGSLYGLIGMAKDVSPLDGRTELDESEGSPMEALLGVQWQLMGDFVASAGGGAGLGGGVGSPDFRLFLGFGYTPLEQDSDGDGISNADDRCPREAEDFDDFNDEDGCPEPDNDGDGMEDTYDKCPLEPEDRDFFEDGDGCPDPDNDGDGIADTADKCPLDGEDEDGFQDTDGCPDPDNDGDEVLDEDDDCPDEAGSIFEKGCPVVDKDNDGVPDSRDQCVDEPETENGYLDEDGCPDRAPSHRVKLTRTSIEILEKVYFKSGKAEILEQSFALLEDVALVLEQNPQITKLRIEGHTDSDGDDKYNRWLSQNRAEAVRKFLIDRGIAPERLVAKGFGETVPIDTNATAEGKANNRRVDFNIVEVNGLPIDEKGETIQGRQSP